MLASNTNAYRDLGGAALMHNISLEFDRNKVRKLAVVNQSLPLNRGIPKNHLLLKLQRFGLTSANLAHPLVPGMSNSWPRLFAHDGDGVGRLPVWGYAEVVESNSPDIEPGMGLYGCFPMTRYLLVDADQYAAKRSEFDFGFPITGAVSTGQSLPIITESESLNDADLQILLRPLLSSAYLIMEELRESEFWQTEQIIITAASSKTAIGLSYFLQELFVHSQVTHTPSLIGLTAQRHQGFVTENGYFDQVFNYDQFRYMGNKDSVLVDFTGNHQLQSMIHYFLKERLIHTYALGACHWQQRASAGQISPDSEQFSAPKYFSQQGGGASDLCQAFEPSWMSASEALRRWLQPELIEGVDEVRWVYEQVLAGNANPKVGYLCQL